MGLIWDNEIQHRQYIVKELKENTNDLYISTDRTMLSNVKLNENFTSINDTTTYQGKKNELFKNLIENIILDSEYNFIEMFSVSLLKRIDYKKVFNPIWIFSDQNNRDDIHVCYMTYESIQIDMKTRELAEIEHPFRIRLYKEKLQQIYNYISKTKFKVSYLFVKNGIDNPVIFVFDHFYNKIDVPIFILLTQFCEQEDGGCPYS